MIFLKKIFFLFSFLLFFLSCGKEDLACNILTGGACAIAGALNINDPCKLGLSSCNNNNGIPQIKEADNTKIDPKDLNTTPTIIIKNTKNANVILNVGEQINVLLTVGDKDLDDVTVSSIVGKPSIASSEVLKFPDRILITALTPGITFAKVYGRDDDNHIGESQKINISVLGGDANATAPKEYAVTFTKDKIVMNTSDFKRIGFTVKGLQPNYTVVTTLAKSNNKLVDINVSTSATSIDIYSNATYGTTVANFVFTDSNGVSLVKDLQIEVTNTETLPPVDPNLTAHTVKDAQACRNNDLWKVLKNSYSVGDRVIDSLNSITFQSLSTATTDILFYYKNTVDTIQPRPDDAMDIKIDEVPKLDGTRDTNKGFIIQTSKGFFNSGFYYVKIDGKCYRGEFPKNDTSKNDDIYKAVKLVID